MNPTAQQIQEMQRLLDTYVVETHSLAAQEVTVVTENGDFYYGEADVYGETDAFTLRHRETRETIIDIPSDGTSDFDFVQKMASLYACLGYNDATFIRDVQKMYESVNQI